MFNINIGIDLGTTNTSIYREGKGLILREATVVATDPRKQKVIAVGNEAKEMVGRTTQTIIATMPVTQGVISDFELTQKMIAIFVKRAMGKNLRRLAVTISLPSGVTEVERRAVEDVAYGAGAKKVVVVEEPIAAAIGAGINIGEANGRLVVDIGGGTSDVAVISLGGIVLCRSLKFAGNDFDEAMVRYVRNEYNVMIGDMTAEHIKMEIGALSPGSRNQKMTFKGRDLVTGLPKELTMDTLETIPVFLSVAGKIVDTIAAVLEETPPELASDIIENGILLTGGGSMLSGFDRIIEERTGVTIVSAADPMSSVGMGLLKMINK